MSECLPNLMVLAHDRSPAGRIRLAEALADTFISHENNLNAAETEQINGFIQELCADTSAADLRRAFAERAAKHTTLPRAVAAQLAADTIDVAAPILKHSPALADEDLLRVIKLDSAPHQIAIAEREAISQAIADALVTTKNPKVVKTLLANMGAKISRPSIEKCTKLAQQIAELRLPLIERPEFTANDAAQLMWWLPRELRQTVLERFGMIGNAANKTSNTSDLIAQMIARFRDHEPTETEAEQVASWLSEHGAMTAQTLVQVLRLRSSPLFMSLLAKMLKMPIPLARQCYEEKSGQLLAVLCRAIGMEKAYFASTFMLAFSNRNSGRAMQPKMLDSALYAFDRLTETRAKTMIKAWRDNPALLKSRV